MATSGTAREEARPAMTDWAAWGTSVGTLVLAGATFAAVRSSNRSARVAERTLLVGLRPLLVTSRAQDPARAGPVRRRSHIRCDCRAGNGPSRERCHLSRDSTTQRRLGHRGPARLSPGTGGGPEGGPGSAGPCSTQKRGSGSRSIVLLRTAARPLRRLRRRRLLASRAARPRHRAVCGHARGDRDLRAHHWSTCSTGITTGANRPSRDSCCCQGQARTGAVT